MSGKNKAAEIVAALVFAAVLSGSAYAAAQSQTYSGSFDGTNIPTLTVGGNCPPTNAKMDVTGKCSGATCTKDPQVILGSRDYHYSQSCRVDLNGPDTCPEGAILVKKISEGSGIIDWWYCDKGDSYSGVGARCCKKSTPFYNSEDEFCYSTDKIWKYSGVVGNGVTVSIPVGTNANPASSALKTVPGNLLVGSNPLYMSAKDLNSFDYTLYWTEETVLGGADNDGDGFYAAQCALGNDCNDNDPNVNPAHLEVPGNGKDDNCDGIVDTLIVNSMNDIAANCLYDSDTKTYSCTGWSNIYMLNDISLPVTGCADYYGDTAGCTASNIVFDVKGNFSAKSLIASNNGGPGGSITISAKNITADLLDTQGAPCDGMCSYTDGYFCSSSEGGPVTLKADAINITVIRANSGGVVPGTGGKINLTANTTIISDIYSNGGDFICGGSHGYDNGAGTGGSIVIKSATTSVSSISVNGGNRNYAFPGNPAGSVKISADSLKLGAINANGATGNKGQGDGGSVRIYNDKYTLNSVSASGPNGIIGFFTDSLVPHKGEYYGGSATLNPFTSPSGNLYTHIDGKTYSGTCDSYYDSEKKGTAWRFPDAAEMTRLGYTICDSCTSNINPCSGCSAYTFNYWYNACYTGGGYTCAEKVGCCPPTNPYYKSSDGKCYQIHTLLNAEIVKTGKRTAISFFVFEADMPSDYKSFRLKIKDPASGKFVKSVYNTDYSQDGVADSEGFVKTLVGLPIRLKLKLATDYNAVLTGSKDSEFVESACNSEKCRDFIVPFAEY